ncbi:MAG: hypothetical protein KatS3mg005_0818 [Bryobacteraceae bacterium]|nr:MAG: hypothetical protein KatS3mg005_0818 [Bryobacteraceae bacterium]
MPFHGHVPFSPAGKGSVAGTGRGRSGLGAAAVPCGDGDAHALAVSEPRPRRRASRRARARAASQLCPLPQTVVPQHPPKPKTAVLRNGPEPAPRKQSREGAARRAATERLSNLSSQPTPPSRRRRGQSSASPAPRVRAVRWSVSPRLPQSTSSLSLRARLLAAYRTRPARTAPPGSRTRIPAAGAGSRLSSARCAAAHRPGSGFGTSQARRWSGRKPRPFAAVFGVGYAGV